MAEIILLHGLSLGPWCWDRTRPHLEALGYRVRAPHLEALALGDGTFSAADQPVSILPSISRICNMIEECQGACTIVASGVSAALALQAYRFIDGQNVSIIGLAGLLPRFGESVLSFASETGLNANWSELLKMDCAHVSIQSDKMTKYFFHDSGLDDVIIVRKSVKAASIKTITTPIDVPDHILRQQPVGYICCLRDRFVPISAQHLMVRRYGIESICNIDCGHAAYFRYPKELAEIIHTLALNLSEYGNSLQETG